MHIYLEKSGKQIELKQAQAELFYKEFRWTRFWGWFFRSHKGYLEGVAPDLKITIDDGSKTSEHFIYSRAVLYDPNRNRSWQFYFAYLLIEWFSEAVKKKP